jgi:hypothetical protein
MNIRFLIWVCLTVVSTVLSSSASSQQRSARLALIIGNANYPDASTPLSTTRDARSLAEELRRTGFEVDLKENLGKAEMQRAIDAFMEKIRSGTAALFYFSGCGIQVARQTYLIPVNAQIWTEAEVRRDGISVDAVLADMHRKGAKVKIVIIDASRRNPFERRFRPAAAGLAAIDAPEGTLAMYSVAPGKVINDGTGTNSLFVSELIKEIRVPGVTAEEVFNRVRVGVSRASNNEQIPWVASSLVDDFFFGAARVTGTAPPAPPSPSTRAKDLNLTRSAESGVDSLISQERGWDRNCNVLPVTVSITKHPVNGAISVVPGVTSTIPASTPRSGSTGACAGKTVTGNEIRFKSNPGFHGTDTVSYDVVFGSQPPQSTAITINVK